ncbi:MAG: stage III sporulation protein AD [Lachnospiraceae bacterium]|nr:stage III sporulation protein AD [Lachnospiraceae bacterium]
MVKIGILGIAVVLLAMPFKNLKGEYSLCISMAGCILIFYFILKKMEQVISTMEGIISYLPIESGYFMLLIKIIGITYISEFCSDICKDAGYSTVAGQISMAGKLTVLGISMPIITTLLELIAGLWQG